jgi:hypothetical protein
MLNRIVVEREREKKERISWLVKGRFEEGGWIFGSEKSIAIVAIVMH